MLRLYKMVEKLPITSLSGATYSKNQIRCLFSVEEMGIGGYVKARNDVEMFVGNSMVFKENFVNKFLGNSSCYYKDFEDGLKDFVHLIDELDSIKLREALIKLVQMQKEYDGDKYRIGTVVMRALHFLGLPNEAIQLFEDDIIRQLFYQFTSHQILFDLLYEHKKYDEILRIYDSLSEDAKLYKYTTVTILATCYRVNTAKSLDQAYLLWKKMTHNNDKHQFRKSIAFVAGLAVNQKQPNKAIEVLKIYQNPPHNFYVSVREIYLLAWAQLGQFEKVFQMLQTILKRHREKKEDDQLTSIQVLNEIRDLVGKNGSKENIDKFSSLRREIENLKLTTKETLDDILCRPFYARKSPPKMNYLLSKNK